MANSPIKTRLSLHKNWKNDLPLKSLWTIDFATRDGNDTATLGKRINTVFSQYERREARDWKIEESLIKDQTDSSGNNGYLLAQAVGFPTESYSISTEELRNSGGFLMGYVSGDRASYGSQNKLDITFLETNIDIIDYFIKPWIIANSHKGLIEDGNADEDIKCTITITLYTRDKNASSSTGRFNSANAKLEPRKKIVFFNAVPFNVAGDAISYGEMSFTELSNKIVSFAFSHYNTVELYYSREAAPQGSTSLPVPAARVIKPQAVNEAEFVGPIQSNPAATYKGTPSTAPGFFDEPAIPSLLDSIPIGPLQSPIPNTATSTSNTTASRYQLLNRPLNNPAATYQGVPNNKPSFFDTPSTPGLFDGLTPAPMQSTVPNPASKYNNETVNPLGLMAPLNPLT